MLSPSSDGVKLLINPPLLSRASSEIPVMHQRVDADSSHTRKVRGEIFINGVIKIIAVLRDNARRAVVVVRYRVKNIRLSSG
jgi:hypothetical protein